MAGDLSWRVIALLILLTINSVLRSAASPEIDERPAVPWTNDEANDAELLKAVQDCVKEWEIRRSRTRSKRSQGSVCYEDVGCFEDSGPFAYLETLPSPPPEINTHFLLYSTISRGDQPLLAVSARNLSAAWTWAERAFDASKPTRVVVHGFGSNCDNVWVYEMRSALMAVEECNVVCVDWEGGSTMPNYLRAAANTRLVGKQLALLLNGLADHIDLKFEDVHIIGFSLGAHVAGFAGSELRNISRITGLDPAGPLFEFQDPRARLDSSDAKFVDVIHSNGENLILGGLGARQPLGHVDFYPNGGRVQHGCSNLFVGAVSDIIWAPTVEGRSLCNHRRAYKFFTDSISPKCHFPAFPCSDYDTFLAGDCFPCTGTRKCGNMGYYADRSLGRGSLYLQTREEDPFCAHQYLASVWSAKSAITSHGRVSIILHGDSGLNETFHLTKRDAELTGSARWARMIVPHPALGVPLRASLIYTAYAGWITAGAPAIKLKKLQLADSYGNVSSFCKLGLELKSDEPADLPLHPGDCPLQDESDLEVIAINNSLNPGNDSNSRPEADPLNNELDAPPQPLAGRAFGVTNIKLAPSGQVEVAEPVLRPRARKRPRNGGEDTKEISEPLLRASSEKKMMNLTVLPLRRGKNIASPVNNETTSSNETTNGIVQFLPARLASFITRAERYARDTILPLVSAYAPRLPSFNARDFLPSFDRYIPIEDDNETSTVTPAPTPTLDTKIRALRSLGPPEVSEHPPALPPVAVESASRRLLIVYSGGRDGRAVKAHSIPEEEQLEAIYAPDPPTAPPPIRVELPVYNAPMTDPVFIPVSYPQERGTKQSENKNLASSREVKISG